MDCVERVYGADRVLHIGHGLRFDMPFDVLLGASDEELQKISCKYDCVVTKHAFAIHEIFGAPYVGFIRNPLDWYISSYFWAKKTSLGDPSEFYGYMIDKHKMSLTDFVHWLHDIGHDNNQTKNFSKLNCGYSDGLPPRPNDISLDDNIFSDLVKFIEDNFTIFAPTDLFGPAVYVMGRLFDWPDLPVWHLRSSSGWRSSVTIPDDLAAFVRERDTHDWRLFETARQSFERRYADLLAGYGDEIRDYDACSRDPAYADATPFRLPARTAELPRSPAVRAKPRSEDTTTTGYLADVSMYHYGMVHGHFLLSRRPQRPPYLAVPLNTLFDHTGNSPRLSDLYHPGTLFDESLPALRQRILAGEVPSLIESFEDLEVWFHRGAYHCLEGRTEGRATAVFTDPDGTLGLCPKFADRDEARRIFRLFTDPFQRERIADFQIVEGREGQPWRAEPRNGDQQPVLAPSLSKLLAALQAAGHLTLTAPPPFLLDSQANFNIVMHDGRYYAARQGAGELEHLLADPQPENLLTAPTLLELRQQIMDRWDAELPPDVYLVDTVGTINIVNFLGRFIALPQKLGSVDLSDAEVLKTPDIVISHSLTRLRHLIGLT